MSFFSQSTSRRLVNNQLANNKSYVMQKYEESVLQASISSKPRSFGALKKFYVNSITTVFKDTLLLYGEEGRNLEFIILMPFTPDEDNQMPHRAMIVHYHINLRSCSSKMREIAIVTTHAMERIIERRRDVRLITLMSEEFNLEFFTNLTQLVIAPHFLSPTPPEDKNFKIMTKTGWACGSIEDGIATITTWYPR